MFKRQCQYQEKSFMIHFFKPLNSKCMQHRQTYSLPQENVLLAVNCTNFHNTLSSSEKEENAVHPPANALFRFVE